MASGTLASREFAQGEGSYLNKGSGGRFIRRIFDLAVAIVGLVIVTPLLLIIAVSIKLDTRGPILLKEKRVGRHRNRFELLEFRKVRDGAQPQEVPVPVGRETELTRVGRIIDGAKLDRLPQLFNVLRGDLSIIGPRPAIPELVKIHPELWDLVLSVRPGVFSVRTNRREPGHSLADDDELGRSYVESVLHDELKTQADYVRDSGLGRDLWLLTTGNGHRRTPGGRPPRTFYAKYGKRLLDLTLGLLVAVLTLPIQGALVLLSAALYGWPPIYRLPSVGKGDSRFLLLQLRTSPAGTRRRRAWPRVTLLIRRSGFDELPQLWNVLKGEMSLVGPRPVRPEDHHELLTWQQQRREVKPGLTGLWQLETRSTGIPLADTAHFDLHYIDRLSFAADIRILMRTVLAIGRRSPESLFLPKAAGKGDILHVRLMLADLALWVGAIPAAAWLRHNPPWTRAFVLGLSIGAALAAALQLLWGKRHGLYRGRRKIASPDDLAVVGAGAAFVTLVLMLARALSVNLPRPGILVIAGSFFFVGAVAARSAAALAYMGRQSSEQARTDRLLVFGAGEAGTNAVRAIWANHESSYLPVAFLDDDRDKHRTSNLGLPVLGGREAVAELASRYNATTLLIAIPSAHPREVNEVAALAKDAGLDVQVLPPLEKWLSALLVERASALAPAPATDRTIDIRLADDRLSSSEAFDLAVIGLGYVGLPLVMEASRVGLRVCGIDIDPARVDALNAGKSHVEGVSHPELSDALNAGFVATTDPSILARAGAITVSVPTPLRDNLPDLGAVISASEAVGDHLRPGQLIVLESTTYPGTTEEVMKPILEERSGLTAGIDFYLAYSPERIDPGNAEWAVHNTPKLIGGIDAESTEQAAMLYGKFCPVVAMSGTREAEMAKLLENTYRHVNIALINEMAIFCRQLDVDIWETIRGASTKPFGFQAFYPGPGVGGHCIPIDPNYLSYRVRQMGEQFRLIELAQEINDFMPGYVADQAIDLLARHGVDAATSHILILGVAYKPDISDIRETPASGVIRRLRSSGAVVEFADPYVESFAVDGLEVIRRTDPVVASSEADLTIIHTPHDALNLTEIESSAKLVFDLRGALPHSRHERL